MALDYTDEPWVRKLQGDYEELKTHAHAAEIRAAELLESNRELSEALEIVRAERSAAWTEFRVIRKEIGADDAEATSDEVARIFNALKAERDEMRRELLAACNEVTDDITRLQWLQSLIHEAQKHADVLSDGDTDAAFTCFSEVQALHDALKAMVNGGVA